MTGLKCTFTPKTSVEHKKIEHVVLATLLLIGPEPSISSFKPNKPHAIIDSFVMSPMLFYTE